MKYRIVEHRQHGTSFLYPFKLQIWAEPKRTFWGRPIPGSWVEVWRPQFQTMEQAARFIKGEPELPIEQIVVMEVER